MCLSVNNFSFSFFLKRLPGNVLEMQVTYNQKRRQICKLYKIKYVLNKDISNVFLGWHMNSRERLHLYWIFQIKYMNKKGKTGTLMNSKLKGAFIQYLIKNFWASFRTLGKPEWTREIKSYSQDICIWGHRRWTINFKKNQCIITLT